MTMRPLSDRVTVGGGLCLAWLAPLLLLCSCAPARHSPHRLPELFAPKAPKVPRSTKRTAPRQPPERCAEKRTSLSPASLSRASVQALAGRNTGATSSTLSWTPVLTGQPSWPGGCPGLQKTQRKQAPKLRVMSFNVNYGGDRSKALRAIARSRADVVALQETTSDWPRLTRRALGKRYPTRLFFSSPGAGGMGFLSRYPLISQRRLPARGGGWFQAWILQLKTPLGKITFLNVHLRPPLGNDGRLSSIPSAYFATRSIRRSELQAHMRHIAPLAPNKRSRPCGVKRRPKGCLPPTVVLGDFNEGRQGLALRWLRKKRGMMSALHRFDKTSPTWTWPTRWWTFHSRLDHVMHSPHLQATSANVLSAAGSDHFPLLVTLTRRPGAPR